MMGFRLVTGVGPVVITVVNVLTTPRVWTSGPEEASSAARTDLLLLVISSWKCKGQRESYAARSTSEAKDLGRENMFATFSILRPLIDE
jgi:hypothetical protein